MQGPQQGHRHEQEHEIDKDVTKAKDVFHIWGKHNAHRCGRIPQFEVEGSGQGPAGEADQEDSDECPHSHDGADRPRRVTKLWDDFENAVEEDQDGEFGEGDCDDV